MIEIGRGCARSGGRTFGANMRCVSTTHFAKTVNPNNKVMN